MVLHVTSGHPRWSRPYAQDPRPRSWHCSQPQYRHSSYSTTTQVQYPIQPVLQHHVRLLVRPHTVRGTHVTSRVPLPGRSVGTRVRSRTALLHPPLPRALFPPLGVLACVRHHQIALYRRPCPCPSQRTCAFPRPSSSPCVLHILPLPSSTFANSPCPPLLQPSSLLVCPSLLHSPGPWHPALLGPAPTPSYASPPYHPSRCNSFRSIRTLGFFPYSWGQSRLTRGSTSPRILLHRPSSISGPLSPTLPALPTRSLKGRVPLLSRLPLVLPAHFT